jgi:putative phosphoesterase
MLIAVLADTHVRDTRLSDGALGLPPGARAALDRAEVVLHAGDLVEAGLLDALRDRAPLHAVLGNNDVTLRGRLPEALVVTFGGVRIGMVHDAGPARGRPARMRRRFPECDVVVFGHSHAPLSEAGVDGQWLFNPGSPTQRRRAPGHTVGLLEVGGVELLRAGIVDADEGMIAPAQVAGTRCRSTTGSGTRGQGEEERW